MARFFIHTPSRLGMSHKLIHIPIKEMKNYFENKRNQDVFVNVEHHSNKVFLVSFVQHYLYRPEDLEDVNMLNFLQNMKSSEKQSIMNRKLFNFAPTPYG